MFMPSSRSLVGLGLHASLSDDLVGQGPNGLLQALILCALLARLICLRDREGPRQQEQAAGQRPAAQRWA